MSRSIALGVLLLVALAPPTLAQPWAYPPGPPYRMCPDTLTIFDLQQTDTTLAPCHPALLDTVLGVRGVVTAFDAKPTGYSFYIENTFVDGPKPWSGLDVFTGSTNYNASVPGTPSGGNLALGDSVVVYGTFTQFPSVDGELEVQGPDGIQSTNDIIIRLINSGNALPPAEVGTTADFDWNPAISAATAGPWAGCLVRVNGPLRVARTEAAAGLLANSFLLVDPGAPTDSILVDGNTLTTFGAPPLGTDVDFVQGVLNRRTTSGVNSFRIQIRDINDIAVSAPPNLVDAYPLDVGKVRLEFDKNLDLATAEDQNHYSLGSKPSGSTIIAATLVGGAGNVVDLDIMSVLVDGDFESVAAESIGTQSCPTCISDAQSRDFVNGILQISDIQQPNPDSLTGVCSDQSRFAGPNGLWGTRLTVRGIAVQKYNSVYYVSDPAAGPRAGVAVFAPVVPLVSGRQYQITGNVQEYYTETEIVNTGHIEDEGPATIPAPVLETVAHLVDQTCDASQALTTGEDYEGVLVRVENVMVVPFNTAPTDPPPGGTFRVVQPGAGASDTMMVYDVSNAYTFDADPGMVLDVTGVLQHAPSLSSFILVPRADSDIHLVSQIDPNRGGNDGFVTVVISGHGFQNGDVARLIRASQADVVGVPTSAAADGRSLTTTFDLRSKPAGLWDLTVSRAGDYADTLLQAFTVETAAAQQIRVDVIGPVVMRPNRRKAFDLVIENLGNADVLDVPLWVAGIPADASVELGFSLASPPQAGGEPDWSQVPLTFAGSRGKYLALVIPRLPPGTSVRRVYLTVPDTVAQFELDAALTPPWMGGAVFEGCLVGGGVITSPGCMAAQLSAIADSLAAAPGVAALSGIGVWAKIAWQCEGAASLPSALAKAEQVLDFMLPPVEGSAEPTGCGDALLPRWRDVHQVTIVTSVDPNKKYGPAPEQQIGVQQVLPYSIQFQNQENATAPAQTVVVADGLNASVYDLNTVSFREITFGDHDPVSPTTGHSGYAADIDLRPDQNLILRLGVSLDLATGILNWSFTSLDPTTMQPPTDDRVGFLPPGGEGSVLFTVMPRPDLAAGATLSNRATIVFDENNPVETDYWVNTLDNTAPESEVLPLPANQDSTTFTVHWVVVGSPPDLRDYSIYVSEDGGAYRGWKVFTVATADTFASRPNHHYAFYSLARDSSGNLEAVPATPDAETTTPTAVGEPLGWRLALEGAVPNPAVAGLRVAFTLASEESAVLEVMDVAGRRVARRSVGALGPGRHVVDLSERVRRPGLYFLRLVQGGRTLHARVVVLR